MFTFLVLICLLAGTAGFGFLRRRTRRRARWQAQRPGIALPPGTPEEIGAALGEELEPLLQRHRQAALVIGIALEGRRWIRAYGAAQPDSIFEIGSLTKTFTGLALAQMAAQGKTSLDEPVRMLLPPGTVEKPRQGAEITLLDLATHHSGLPRLPGNLHAWSLRDPYARYGSTELDSYLRRRGLARPGATSFLYSNLGFGLLGHALALHAGCGFEELIRRQIAEPLELRDTAIELSREQRSRCVQGHRGRWKPVSEWRFKALAGAGALRSTACDLLTYLEAHLHPERVENSSASPAAGTLSQALAVVQELRAGGPGPLGIGLAWLINPAHSALFHNGGTGGFSSFASVNRERGRAIVVLFNCFEPAQGELQFAEVVAAHVSARLDGRPVPGLSL